VNNATKRALKSSLNTVNARQVSVITYQNFSIRCWKRTHYTNQCCYIQANR